MALPNIPAEGAYTDIELDWIDLEPPGLFPTNQDSYWGQVRKIFTDDLQFLADLLSQAWYNLDPATADDTAIGRWESDLGIPVAGGSRTLDERRAFVISRRQKGPFTRTRRNQIIEAFIKPTLGVGTPITFTNDGVALTDDGLIFADEETVLDGSYNVIEDIPGFAYSVRINELIALDEPGLTRELDRITPWPIEFTLDFVHDPFMDETGMLTLSGNEITDDTRDDADALGTGDSGEMTDEGGF